MSDVSELIELLSHSSSEKRASAAKKLRKGSFSEAGPAVLAALTEELKDARTWKAQFYMILALGELQCHAALPMLWSLTAVYTQHSILYIALGDAIVRLNPKEKQVSVIFELAETNNLLLLDGAFHAMSKLRLVPNDEEIAMILRMAEDPRAEVEVKGYPGDRRGLRLWVALSAADWPRDLVRSFLDSCLVIPDQGLQVAATSSLNGKYTKWTDL